MIQNFTASSTKPAIGSAASQLSQNPSSSTTNAMGIRKNFVGIWIRAYTASLVRVGVMVPVIASIIAVTLYLALPNSPLPPFLGVLPGSQWYTLVYSSFFTGILWLIVALPFCYLSTAQGANPRNYTLLRSRLHQLKASLGMKDHADDALEEINTSTTAMLDSGSGVHDKHTCNVLKEASACCIDISRKLYKFPAGLPWIIGTAYNSAWALLHHAEEVMIEVANVEEAVHGAKHDFLAIQDSQIQGKDELLDDVIQAVNVLKPEALAYFKEDQPRKSRLAPGQPTQLINTSSNQSGASSLASNASGQNGTNPDARTRADAMARVMLREVRSTLNDFRDKRWEGLVRQRGRLLMSIAVTGIVTHALLCVTILTGSTLVATQQFTTTQSDIMAATAFYMVGAISGLFVRFYSESRGGSSVDDFGLSSTRLVAIPLLSGLAGIGGVFLAEVLAALGGSALIGSTLGKPIVLSTLFSLDPRLLLTAAVFGVTPNLLIKGLQEKANKYATELQSSKAAETPVAGAKV
jgi:hypothetical protein